MRVTIDFLPVKRMQVNTINEPGDADIDGITTSSEFTDAVASAIAAAIGAIAPHTDFATLKIGNVAAGNYTEFESDGTMIAYGLSTAYRDELQSLASTRLVSPSGDFQLNDDEGAIEAKTSSRYPTDYLVVNHQLNHDWKNGTSIYPHLHTWQTTSGTPHWLIGYRWQKQGSEKTTAWTLDKWASNAFLWSAGTLNQIVVFPAIAAPVGYGQVSDIVQFKIYRDYTNASTKFTGGDPVNASQYLVNFDTHIQIDSLGSRQEYIK